MSKTWVRACAIDDVDEKDVIRFDYRTGAAKGPPVCLDLKTYSTRGGGGEVFIEIA